MRGPFLSSVGGRGGLRHAAGLLLHPGRAPPRTSARYSVRSHPFAAHVRNTDSAASSRFAPPSASAAAAAAAASCAGAASRNGFVGWYLAMIEARPVLTKGVTAGVIFTAADLSSQIITLSSLNSIDWIRTMRMAGYGLLISGPSLHLWFNSVSKFIPKCDIICTLKKILLGQAVYGPIMTSVFFSINACLQGESAVEIVARLKRDLIPTLRNGLVYWPICDFITFRFVPVHLQPLVSNSFSFLWTIYLTYMASLKKAMTKQVVE